MGNGGPTPVLHAYNNGHEDDSFVYTDSILLLPMLPNAYVSPLLSPLTLFAMMTRCAMITLRGPAAHPRIPQCNNEALASHPEATPDQIQGATSFETSSR